MRFLPFFFLLFFLSFSFATINMNVVIDTHTLAEVKYDIVNSQVDAKIYLDNVKHLETNCDVKDNIIYLKKGDVCNVSFSTDNLITKENGIYSFNFKDYFMVDELKIVIPEGFILENVDYIQSLTYENNNIVLTYNNIIPYNLNINLERGEKKYIVSNALLFLIGFPIIILIFALIFAFIYLKKNKNYRKGQKNIYDTLSDPEQKILDVLFPNKILTQKQIVLETNLPKSTVSRWINKLVDKNILKVSDSFHIRKVMYSDWFRNLK